MQGKSLIQKRTGKIKVNSIFLEIVNNKIG